VDESVARAVLLALDLVAVAVTFRVAGKFGRNFIGGGALGILLELVRIGCAMALTKAAEPWSPSDTTVWLINFRLYNMPVVVACGVLAGGAASSSVSATGRQQAPSLPSDGVMHIEGAVEDRVMRKPVPRHQGTPQEALRTSEPRRDFGLNGWLLVGLLPVGGAAISFMAWFVWLSFGVNAAWGFLLLVCLVPAALNFHFTGTRARNRIGWMLLGVLTSFPSTMLLLFLGPKQTPATVERKAKTTAETGTPNGGETAR